MCRSYRLAGILAGIFALLSAPAAAQPGEPQVRVLLLERQEPIAASISAHGGSIRLFAGDYSDPIATLRPGEEATFRVASRQLHLQVGEHGIFARELRAEPDSGAQFDLKVVEGRQSPVPLLYQGRLEISADTENWALRLVNEVGLEEYVAAVISREYGFDDREGAKAMAVIIRTYALSTLGRSGTGYDHVDHTMSQMYQGTRAVTPAILEAARETRGEVLTYNGKLIEAVYFAYSGGHTADNETVWRSAALPYLRGKPDPFGQSAPDARWRSTVPRTRLLGLLSVKYGFDVVGFNLGERGPDERVQTINLLKGDGGRHTIRANDFRMLILQNFDSNSLKSTLFTARREGDTYVFEGRGNGHGVGLSQWGAHELARQGKTYPEIIDFYYTGVKLQRLDELLSPEPAAVADEERPARRGRIGW